MTKEDIYPVDIWTIAHFIAGLALMFVITIPQNIVPSPTNRIVYYPLVLIPLIIWEIYEYATNRMVWVNNPLNQFIDVIVGMFGSMVAMYLQWGSLG